MVDIFIFDTNFKIYRTVTLKDPLILEIWLWIFPEQSLRTIFDYIVACLTFYKFSSIFLRSAVHTYSSFFASCYDIFLKMSSFRIIPR